MERDGEGRLSDTGADLDASAPHLSYQATPQVLRAGPLTALFDGVSLRYIRYGSSEVIRRIYLAVRDGRWGTVPADCRDLILNAQEDSFEIGFTLICNQDEIRYEWRIVMYGTQQGQITAQAEGVALTSFSTCRIGICVLHPIKECVGKTCVVTDPAGKEIEVLFPQQIAAGAPFGQFIAMRYEVKDAVEASISFEGDIFELEDQRNWTDSSFKTYSRPHSLPYPYLVEKGDQIWQKIRLSLIGADSPRNKQMSEQNEVTTVVMGGKLGLVPRLGLQVNPNRVEMSERTIELLRPLRLAHLRVNLDLSGHTWKTDLARADRSCSSIGSALELGLYNPAEEQIAEFASQIDNLACAVERCLLFPSKKNVFKHVSNLLRSAGLRVVAGSDENFAELADVPLAEIELDAVSFALNPQVHVSDDLSLFENLEAQGDAVRSAQTVAGGSPVVVSPVTLLPGPRSDLVADPRQSWMLAACWTIGSIKYLAEGGASSGTYFETDGPRGILDVNPTGPLGTVKEQLPGISPIYLVFALLAGTADTEILKFDSSDPLKILALGFLRNRAEHCIIANFTRSAQRIRVGKFSHPISVRLFTEETFREIDGEWLPAPGQSGSPEEGWCRLSLKPYSLAYIRCSDTVPFK